MILQQNPSLYLVLIVVDLLAFDMLDIQFLLEQMKMHNFYKIRVRNLVNEDL